MAYRLSYADPLVGDDLIDPYEAMRASDVITWIVAGRWINKYVRAN